MIHYDDDASGDDYDLVAFRLNKEEDPAKVFQ